MDMIDWALDALAGSELPAEAAAFTDRVMTRIAAVERARQTGPSLGIGMGAATAAMILGAITAAVPMSPGPAPLELSVFSPHAALAPATLLATAR